MTGRRCAHVAACTASQGVMGGVCPITSRDGCTWYEPEIDRDWLLEIVGRLESEYPDSRDAAVCVMDDVAKEIREAVGA